MKPRTPDVNQELLKSATGSLFLITDPRSDAFLRDRKTKQAPRTPDYLEQWDT